VPDHAIRELFESAGYHSNELVTIFKYQTETHEVLRGYADAERCGVEFDFYTGTGANEIWERVRSVGLGGEELKCALKRYRKSATEALRLFESGSFRTFGIVAQMLCGTRKPEAEKKAGIVPDIRADASVLSCIGNTPLVHIRNKGFPCPVYLKLEMLNPGGSMKDRVALHMVEIAEREGLLKPGGTIVEASSGNQGAALAMIGAAKGYRVIIAASEKISEEKHRTLRALGAEVRVYPAVASLEDPDGYYMAAKRLSDEIPGAYWPNQYHNPLNPEAHYLTTGPEVWEQSEGRLTHFFAAAGSSGTVCGVGRFLKEKARDAGREIKIIAVDAATSSFSSVNPKPYKAEGLGIDYLPAFLDRSVIDEFMVATDDEAFSNARRLAREQGVLAGGSGGAVMHSLFQYAPRLVPDDFVVALLADSGKQYLGKIFGPETNR
jgi:cystathionine beta-synthase